MIFGPELIGKVLDGGKTVTRRRSEHRDGRPLRYWMVLHGGWNRDEPEVRIAFRRAPDYPRCAK